MQEVISIVIIEWLLMTALALNNLLQVEIADFVNKASFVAGLV